MPLDISTLYEYVNDTTPQTKIQKIYEQGKISGILMAMKQQRTTLTKLAIPIGLIVILLILANSGMLDNLPLIGKPAAETTATLIHLLRR